MRSITLQIAATVLSLAAADVSFNLLVKHMRGSSGLAWFEAGCTPDKDSDAPGTGGGADCNAVLATPWSYVPPRFEDDPPGKYSVQVPAAFLGLVYYSALTVWFVAVGCPARSRRWVLVAPLVVVLLGLASSAFFTYIMFTNIDEWCPWCMVTHGLNVLIAVCLVLMWPRKPKSTPQTGRVPDAEAVTVTASARAAAAPPTHPSNRLLLTTAIALGLLLFGQVQMLGQEKRRRQAVAAQRGFDQCKAVVDRLIANTRMLVQGWQAGQQFDFQLRPDDPVRTHGQAGDPAWEVVVFSDLACPPCRITGQFLAQEVQPMFGGNLKIIFKHYPLNSECNVHVKTKVHKYACVGAAIAEAARLLRGNDGFWQAYDLLLANQREFNQGKLTPENVAIRLGFDPAQFKEAMQSPTTASRVWEDVNGASNLGIRGTPTVFVNRRKVDGIAVRNIDFWDMLADVYWQDVKQARPESTRPTVKTPTPGSPDRKAVP